MFEDFNYNLSNQYILVDPHYNEEEYMSDPDLEALSGDGKPLQVKTDKKGKLLLDQDPE